MRVLAVIAVLLGGCLVIRKGRIAVRNGKSWNS